MERNQYISIFDVFDYLEANGYIGGIEVADRESSKTILFAKEGVYVLSKGRRKGMRLMEILRREGSIDRQVIEDALSDERSTNFQKTLGEILVDQGELSQKVLEIKLRGIVESELYDLFLWKEGKYTFDPSATKESKFSARGGYTFYATDQVKLGQTFIGKMQEWNLAPHSIPDLTTMYAMDDSQFGRLKDLGLTRKMIQESQLFGENSIQEILDQTTLNKGEICHLIFTLLRENILSPLNVEVAKQKGLSAEAQNNFGKAATYYAYVSFSGTPDLGSIRKLVELLDKANRRHEAVQMLDNVGWAFYDRGKFTNAIQVAMILLEHTPGHQSAIALEFNGHAQLQNSEKVRQVGETLGALLMSKKKLKEAIDHYKYLLQWFPEDLNIQCALADVHIKTNNISEGLQLLSSCAYQFESSGKKEEALRTYKQILDVDPNRSDISKKVRSIELKKTLIKVFLFVLPLMIIVGGIVFYIKQEAARQIREKTADQLYTKAFEMEKKLPKMNELAKKLGAVEKDKTFQKYQQEFEAVDQKYHNIVTNYKGTSSLVKAETRWKNFQTLLTKARKLIKIERDKRVDLALRKQQRKEAQARQIATADLAKKEGVTLLEDGKYKEAGKKLKEAFDMYMNFYNKYTEATNYLTTMRLPMILDSVPRGAVVYEGDRMLNKKKISGKTPLVYFYPLKTESSELVFTFKTKGFKKLITDAKRDPQWMGKPLKWDRFQVLRPTLNMKPIASYDGLAGPAEASFLMHQGLLMFGARDGNLYGIRFRGDRASLRWNKRLGSSFGDMYTSPIQIRRLAFFGNTAGTLQAIGKGSDGKMKRFWAEKTGGAILDTPYLYPDPDIKKRYWIGVGNTGHYAHIFRIDWRRQVAVSRYFTYHAENRIVASPVINGNYVYVPGTDNFLVCFDYVNFSAKREATLRDARWVFEGEKDFSVRPVLCLDYLLQGCDDGNIYAVDAEKGKEKWRVTLEEKVTIPPLLLPPRIQKEFSKMNNGFLTAKKGYQRGKISKTNFKNLKKQLALFRERCVKKTYVIFCVENRLVAFSLAVLEKNAILAKSNETTFSLKGQNLPVLWSHSLKGKINRPPLLQIKNNQYFLYVTTNRGYVYCFNISKKPSDMLKWQYYSPHLTSPVYVWKNRLFFADKLKKYKGGKAYWEYRVNCLLIDRQ